MTTLASGPKPVSDFPQQVRKVFGGVDGKAKALHGAAVDVFLATLDELWLQKCKFCKGRGHQHKHCDSFRKVVTISRGNRYW